MNPWNSALRVSPRALGPRNSPLHLRNSRMHARISQVGAWNSEVWDVSGGMRVRQSVLRDVSGEIRDRQGDLREVWREMRGGVSFLHGRNFTRRYGFTELQVSKSDLQAPARGLPAGWADLFETFDFFGQSL